MRLHPIATIAVAALALAAAPALGAGFQLYGSYWDTSDVDATAGGGLALAFPLGSELLDLELRGTYYQELDNASFSAVIDDDENFFQQFGLEVVPIEAGARFNFPVASDAFRPYLGGGVSYMMIDVDDSRFDVDDETGYYAALGSKFGDPDGMGFYVEGLYRSTEATVRVEPDQFEDLDDIDIDEDVAIDLDGVSVNAGVTWSF